jgi:outer membrane protein TolC
MFMATEHQWMLGVEFPLPIQRGTRAGAVDEASALAALQRSELSREADAVRREVDVARSRVVEAIHVVRLYRKRLLVVARAQVAASRSGYQTGANDFVAVIGAEKNQRDVELAYYVALAELSKRRARLARALGEMPGLDKQGGRQ